MAQISEQDFRGAIIATKKDAKLVAAARNERTNTAATMYQEFLKLPVDRQREIIIAIASEYFVAAQWKIGYPLNNAPADQLKPFVSTVAKTLFFTRDDGAVRETLRTLRLYQESPHFVAIATALGETPEVVGPNQAKVARILGGSEIYQLLQSLEEGPAAARVIQGIVRIAMWTRDAATTKRAAEFLYARRLSASLPEIAALLENSVFLAASPQAAKRVVEGLISSPIDALLQTKPEDSKRLFSAITDVAWRTKNPEAIRNFVSSQL